MTAAFLDRQPAKEPEPDRLTLAAKQSTLAVLVLAAVLLLALAAAIAAAIQTPPPPPAEPSIDRPPAWKL